MKQVFYVGCTFKEQAKAEQPLVKLPPRMPEPERKLAKKAVAEAEAMAKELAIKFDRVAYQREYMKLWRAKKKAEGK